MIKYDEMRVSMLVGMLQADFAGMDPEEIYKLSRGMNEAGLAMHLARVVDKHGIKKFAQEYCGDLDSWLEALKRFERINYNKIRANRRKRKKEAELS